MRTRTSSQRLNDALWKPKLPMCAGSTRIRGHQQSHQEDSSDGHNKQLKQPSFRPSQNGVSLSLDFRQHAWGISQKNLEQGAFLSQI